MLGLRLRAARSIWARERAIASAPRLNRHILPAYSLISRGISRNSTQPDHTSSAPSEFIDDAAGKTSSAVASEPVELANLSDEIAPYILHPDTLSSLGLLSMTPAGFYRWIASQIHFLEPTLPWSCTLILAFFVIRLMIFPTEISRQRLMTANNHIDKLSKYVTQKMNNPDTDTIAGVKRILNDHYYPQVVGIRNPRWTKISVIVRTLLFGPPTIWGAYIGVYRMCAAVPQLQHNTGLEWMGITNLAAGDPTPILGALCGTAYHWAALAESKSRVHRMEGKDKDELPRINSFLLEGSEAILNNTSIFRWLTPLTFGLGAYVLQVPVGLLLVFMTNHFAVAVQETLLINPRVREVFGILPASIVVVEEPEDVKETKPKKEPKKQQKKPEKAQGTTKKTKKKK
ncbi:hypothetical protein VNI00_012884 [Paramarasmius palmivorus]|uniref:Uncharacterized protein n=1 Tax=Paramarasmius palmivorus TaxID=297713 RepID=A0AAW0BYT6_9AGAR